MSKRVGPHPRTPFSSPLILRCATGFSVTDLHGSAIGILGRFISVREPNIRYLGLETMSRMAAIPESLPSVKRHLSTIQISLKDTDISIRKRALDLLYVMCDKTNAQPIVQELIKFLHKSDFAIREELVCTSLTSLSPFFCLATDCLSCVFCRCSKSPFWPSALPLT